MRLFIIGNGFDLAHELPTRYWDFRTYLENLYPDFLNEFEQHYYIYPKDSDKYKQELLWNNFETNLANIDEDIIIEEALGIDMGLESGDYGIEDTLRSYFSSEYQYINKLAIYLKQWVRTIRISDTLPITSQISKDSEDYFVTFNYTSVLENVYKVAPSNILHIHGSLHEYNDDPILGHGNRKRIEDIKAKRNQAETWFNEKEMSICAVVADYYNTTFKNVNNYMHKLNSLFRCEVEEIVVIGHSVAGIDLPYFKRIDQYTGQKSIWRVYYFTEDEKVDMQKALIEQGISKNRLRMRDSKKFYDKKKGAE